MGGPRLQYTKDYEMFELHPYNRDFHKDKVLRESMAQVGFMPSSPLQCVKNGDGKLKIIRGHHRFDNAKDMGIGVWYVVDETNTDIFSLEGGKSQWTSADFAKARANAGDDNCIELLNFMKKHGLPLSASASLIGGQSAGSGNKGKMVKSGTFRIGDMKHAKEVVAITDRMRELRIPFATAGAFVSAISTCLRIPEFNTKLFLHKISLNGSQMRKRGTAKEYIEEIEAFYNYGSAKNRLPVAFRAREIAKERALSFGQPKK